MMQYEMKNIMFYVDVISARKYEIVTLYILKNKFSLPEKCQNLTFPLFLVDPPYISSVRWYIQVYQKYFIQIISGKKDKRPKKAIKFVPNALKWLQKGGSTMLYLSSLHSPTPVPRNGRTQSFFSTGRVIIRHVMRGTFLSRLNLLRLKGSAKNIFHNATE